MNFFSDFNFRTYNVRTYNFRTAIQRNNIGRDLEFFFQNQKLQPLLLRIKYSKNQPETLNVRNNTNRQTDKKPGRQTDKQTLNFENHLVSLKQISF
jgi:hypothetical protein